MFLQLQVFRTTRLSLIDVRLHYTIIHKKLDFSANLQTKICHFVQKIHYGDFLFSSLPPGKKNLSFTDFVFVYLVEELNNKTMLKVSSQNQWTSYISLFEFLRLLVENKSSIIFPKRCGKSFELVALYFVKINWFFVINRPNPGICYIFQSLSLGTTQLNFFCWNFSTDKVSTELSKLEELITIFDWKSSATIKPAVN